jgi:hypothetical protein
MILAGKLMTAAPSTFGVELRLPNAGKKGLARAANKKPQRLAEDCLSGRYR